MRILGIDPGLAIVGFGLIEADAGRTQLLQYGTVTTPAGLPLSDRLVQLERDTEELLAQLRPDAIAIEELFFSNNITTGIAVAHARGILLCTAAKSGIPLYEYTPMQVKQAVVGYGLAEKRQDWERNNGYLVKAGYPLFFCRHEKQWIYSQLSGIIALNQSYPIHSEIFSKNLKKV